MSTAEEYKNAGNAAWSSGNYDEAIKQFTSAIGVASSSEFLKTIYSNRSAAYMKISQYQSALLDANKCIEIDCNWAKGYVRKGDALYSLKKYTECYNAYNYALRITPNDTSVQQKCELAQKAIRDSVNDTQQQQQQQQQQQTLLSQQTTNPTPKRPSPTRSLGGSSVQSNNSKLNTKKKQSNPAHPPPMRAGSISTLKSPHPSASTLLQTQSPAISKKPLYSWEVASDFDDSEASSGYYPAVLRERIYTVDYGSFIPSDKRGVYIRENNETDELDNNSEYSDFPHTPYLSKQSSTSPLKRSTSYTSPSPNSPHTTNTPQGYLDVQIVFSENEFNAFILRKNLTLKNKNFKSKIILEKHASKYTDAKCKESKFLRTQTPYIDNKRILKELYRPEQPNKWIDNKGFQLTNTRIEID